MKLILVRHGETVENNAGIIQGHLPGKLSENGIVQSKKIALYLQDTKINFIYSSDLARSVDTTREIIDFHKGAPVRYWKLIRERHLGELQGKSREDLGWNHKGHKRGFLQPEKGETIETLFERAKKVLDMLTIAHPDDSVLLVTHGGLAKAMISIMENLGLEGYSTLPGLENTGVSTYNFNEESGFQRLEFNSVSHLR